MVTILGGVFVTRRSGTDFLPLSRAIANAGQTFPPVAVLALAVPAMGFGAGPTLSGAVSLRATADLRKHHLWPAPGLPAVLDAADGMGMNPTQRRCSRWSCRWRCR